MKLTEVLVSLAISLIAVAVFTASVITVHRGINKTETISKNALTILETDAFLRKHINEFDVPYWKSFDKAFEIIQDKLAVDCAMNGISVVSIASLYDKKHNSEGVCIEWQHNGKHYTTKEIIKQRIIDETQ